MADVVRPFLPVPREMMGQVLSVIEEALSANRTDEADHLSRLTDERYCDLLQLAQGKVRSVERKPVSEMTWEEFVVQYQARNSFRGSPKATYPQASQANRGSRFHTVWSQHS